MVIAKLKDMKDGWFIGDFYPTTLKTNQFEVGYKTYKKDSFWAHHYHKEVLEINLLIRGKMELQNQIITAGDIFILSPWEITNPKFLEDCEVLVVKIPSIPTDKYIIKDA
jgi:quercetin dioxygenase-like cupin family protein